MRSVIDGRSGLSFDRFRRMLDNVICGKKQTRTSLRADRVQLTDAAAGPAEA